MLHLGSSKARSVYWISSYPSAPSTQMPSLKLSSKRRTPKGLLLARLSLLPRSSKEHPKNSSVASVQATNADMLHGEGLCDTVLSSWLPRQYLHESMTHWTLFQVTGLTQSLAAGTAAAA